MLIHGFNLEGKHYRLTYQNDDDTFVIDDNSSGKVVCTFTIPKSEEENSCFRYTMPSLNSTESITNLFSFNKCATDFAIELVEDYIKRERRKSPNETNNRMA